MKATPAAPLSEKHPLGKVAAIIQKTPAQSFRVHRVDGTVIDCTVAGMSEAELYVMEDETARYFSLRPSEIVFIEASLPRRKRELALAILGIPTGTALLVAYSWIPGVQPDEGHMMWGFIILVFIAMGILSIPGVKKLLSGWLTTWERVD